MPDTELKTVSATQMPALFGRSPYDTRYTLYQRFRSGNVMGDEASSRMDWGKKLEPLVLAQAAEEQALEITPNHEYVRNGILGATRDATIIAPDKGPGIVECKCVFDFGTWGREWELGDKIPPHIELQVQQQMAVGDGEKPYDWGIIVVWVCGGDLLYFERKPRPDAWAQMETEAQAFLDQVAKGDEPDPFGLPVEIPWLSSIERVEGKEIDVTDPDVAIAAHSFNTAGIVRRQMEKMEQKAKAALLAAAGDAERMFLADGSVVSLKSISRSAYTREVEAGRYTRLKVDLPQPPEEITEAEAIEQAKVLGAG